MDSTKRRPHTRAFFDEGDLAIKIVAADKDVIEQSRNLIRRPGYRRRENGSSGQGKKEPTRHHPRLPFFPQNAGHCMPVSRSIRGAFPCYQL
jgi:hypothetical protein